MELKVVILFFVVAVFNALAAPTFAAQSVPALAAPTSAAETSVQATKQTSTEVSQAKSVQATSDIQKSHSFEDLLVQGKYHFSDQAVATVEEDKVLDALIGVRQDFKDRLEESVNQK